MISFSSLSLSTLPHPLFCHSLCTMLLPLDLTYHSSLRPPPSPPLYQFCTLEEMATGRGRQGAGRAGSRHPPSRRPLMRNWRLGRSFLRPNGSCISVTFPSSRAQLKIPPLVRSRVMLTQGRVVWVPFAIVLHFRCSQMYCQTANLLI